MIRSLSLVLLGGIVAFQAQAQTPPTTTPPSNPPPPTPIPAVVAPTPAAQTAAATTIVVDTFDSVTQWTATPADGVEISVHPDSNGVHGKAMRVDFDFHGHGGYAVIHRPFNLALPQNYEFSFAIKGDAPTNTLEFKLIDSTGDNVWWNNGINVRFPEEWRAVTLKKRHITFAWGPAGGGVIRRVAAIEIDADAVGLSGLITPSLDEMVHVAKEMERRGMDLPLLIGGATTSRQHTAVRIAPSYSQPVVHVIDASRVVGVVQSLLDPERKITLDEGNRELQAKLRAQHEEREKTPLLPYRIALQHKTPITWSDDDVSPPPFTGTRTLEPALEELREVIDWTFFFAAWELKGRFPAILEHPQYGAAARELGRLLAEENIELVERNGAPRGERYFAIYNPPVVNRQLGIRRSYIAETRRMALKFIENDLPRAARMLKEWGAESVVAAAYVARAAVLAPLDFPTPV